MFGIFLLTILKKVSIVKDVGQLSLLAILAHILGSLKQVFGPFGSVRRFQVLLGIKSASPYSLSAEGSMSCSKVLCETVVALTHDIASKIITDCENFIQDLKQVGFCVLSLPP